MFQQNVADVIMHHLRASGPVSFGSIVAYVHEQHDKSTPAWSVAECLNVLIVQQKAYLYDTGTAFDVKMEAIEVEPLKV
jgi:hypothetical protein